MALFFAIAIDFEPLEKPATDCWKVIRDKVYQLADKLYKANIRLFSRDNARGAVRYLASEYPQNRRLAS